jgi:hypothetical protein
LNISYEAYRDLEWFDEEIVDALSFDQLFALATAIKLELRHFFGAGNLGQVTFTELATRLESSATDSASLAALEERVGWELGRHLDDPSTFGELPAIALADIGKSVGVDWRSLLPPLTRSWQQAVSPKHFVRWARTAWNYCARLPGRSPN